MVRRTRSSTPRAGAPLGPRRSSGGTYLNVEKYKQQKFFFCFSMSPPSHNTNSIQFNSQSRKRATSKSVVVKMQMVPSSQCLKALFRNGRDIMETMTTESILSSMKYGFLSAKSGRGISFQGSQKHVHTTCRLSIPGTTISKKDNAPLNYLRDRKLVPDSCPPSIKDLNLLYQLVDQSSKLVVLTGAGISTECGIPDYRSPNGAYSTGFKPITHQEFVRSTRARRRYWARSFAGWRRFTAAQPGAAHLALASLEKVSRLELLITQNVDRLHHRAGSNPLELHGSVYSVICLECGHPVCRDEFQDEVKALNPKWATAIENLKVGDPGSDKSFGMKQRPDGDVEIDEKFWEEDFHIPTCKKCNGVLKPDVVFFGDNVPKDRADKAMEAAKGCDGFLVLGSSLMTMSAFRLVRAAHEAGALIAIVNIGVTRADDFVPLKINARCGEILPRLLDIGCLTVPSLQ